MNEDKSKRLEKLRGDGRKCGGDRSFPEITYPDLKLLLQEDEEIRRLIREMVSAEETPNNEVLNAGAAYATPVTDRKQAQGSNAYTSTRYPAVAPAPVPPKDLLRDQLTAELKLLEAVKADAELAGAWLEANESEGRKLMRLLSMVSEWEEVLRLWGRLADRCKKDQRTATDVELQILQAVLAFNNLRWRDRSASLVTAQVGVEFHHETMERGTPKGSTVQAVWLPGIANAAGQVQKKPVVKTN